MKLSLSFSTGRTPTAKGTVVATANTRTGWEAYGIPADAGDGFAYNAEGRLYGNRVVSERTVLQLDTALACVRLLSQTIATLPLGLFRRFLDGSRRSAPNHALYDLLHSQPNADMTAVDFWQVMITMMLLRGTAFAEISRIGDRIVSIDPLSRGVLSWTRRGDVYEFTYTVDGRARKIARRDLWILPAFTLDGIFGISPICYGANIFAGAQAADRASLSTFENGMSASGFVSYGKGATDWLTTDQRDQLRSNIARFAHGGQHASGVFVLEGGMGYTPMSMNPDDAQMLETRSFNVEVICRWFGVPPTLVFHGDKTSNWGTGLEQQNLAFLTYHLRPWLSKIEQSIRKNLLAPVDRARYFAEFNVEGLLRADTAGRASWYSTMLMNGVVTRDEVRLKENLEPMGGNAAVLTVQSALVPLDKLGEKPATVPPAGATEPAKPEDEA